MTWIHGLAWLLLLSCGMPAHAQATERADGAQRTWQATVPGRIEIAPDGSVASFRHDATLPDLVADVLDARIRQWRFAPVVVDGRPVRLDTGLSLDLEASAMEDGGLRLEIMHARFGARRALEMTPPRYPGAPLRAGVQARLVLALRLGADGEVLDVAVERASLAAAAPGRRRQDYLRAFEKAGVEAAKRWRFGPGERVDGVPRDESIMRTPVEFLFADAKPRWVSMPVPEVPWLDEVPALGEEEGMQLVAGVAHGDEIVPQLLVPLDGAYGVD